MGDHDQGDNSPGRSNRRRRRRSAQLSRDTFCAAFGDLYRPQDLQAFLDDGLRPAENQAVTWAIPNTGVWLAERDGAAIGCALAGPCDLPHPEVTATCAELKRIYLAPCAQGAGLGLAPDGAGSGVDGARGAAPDLDRGLVRQPKAPAAFMSSQGFAKGRGILFQGRRRPWTASSSCGAADSPGQDRFAPPSSLNQTSVRQSQETAAMFMRFFTELKQARVPVTLKEYLMLMEGMDKSVINRRVEESSIISRARPW